MIVSIVGGVVELRMNLADKIFSAAAEDQDIIERVIS